MRRLGKLKNILLLTVIMVAASVCVALAARVEYVEGKRVYDYADLFSGSEEEALEEYALSIEEDAKTEFYVLTIDDADGKSAMEYADDFGDNGAFGYEEEYGTYIVMIIDMDNREVWISTSGKAIEYLNDNRIDRTLDAMFEYVPDGEYYEAAEVYLQFAYKYMLTEPAEDYNDYYDDDDYYPDNDYDDTYYYDDGYYDDTEISEIIIPCFIGSAVISGVILAIMASSAKTKMTVGSTTYIGASGLKINQRDDIYTHTTTVKRRIESDNGSSGGSRSRSGGSSVHRSSGGRRHGGGGRRF